MLKPSLDNRFGVTVVATFFVLVSFAAIASAQPTPTPTATPAAPSKCANHDEDQCIQVRVAVMAPQVVADTFGKRIAQNFVAIQVTISNWDKDYQYLINDVGLDLKRVFTPRPYNLIRNRDNPEQPDYGPFLSSAELSLLRGVAEKGQGQDKRNLILRLFRGVGTIAAGFIGVASFGPSYPKSVAVFNGPVISAFSEAFPDYTINQMNRLSDSAYQANTLVPTSHSKIIVAFIDQSTFLSKSQRKLFWNDVTALYPDPKDGNCQIQLCADFRNADAWILGNFITDISNIAPIVTTAQFDATEMQQFQNEKPVVKGYILGQFLTGTSISLLNQEPKGLSIAADGAPTAGRLNFVIKSDKPVPPGTTLHFEVVNGQGIQTYAKQVSYMPDAPTVTTITPSTGKQNTSVTVTLKGTNFIPGAGNTRVRFDGNDVEVTDPTDVLGTSLKVTFKLGKTTVGSHNVTVINANSESAPVSFTVTAATPNP